MRCVQVLSALALQRLLQCTAGDSHVSFASIEPDHLARALRQANAQAWLAVQVLLAGKPLWERAQLTWERSLEADFFRPLRGYLNNVALGPLDPDVARRKTSQALVEALANGLLLSGDLHVPDLLPEAPPRTDLHELCQAEMESLGQLSDDLQQTGHLELKDLLALRAGKGEALVVLLTASLVRHAVEVDADLFGELAVACQASQVPTALDEYRCLAVTLDRHRGRLEDLLKATWAAWNADSPSPAATVAPPAVPERPPGTALVPVYVQRGDAYRLNSDYGQAVAEYSTALRLDPSNALVLIQRGQMHLLSGKHQEAIADFTAALEQDPSNPTAHCYRGKALAETGELDEALVNLSEALRLDPSNAWAYHFSGDVHAARNERDQAIAKFSDAIRLNPLVTLSYLRRGECHAADQEYERAAADFSLALQLDPQNAIAYLGRGAAYREIGKLELAEADLTRALQLDYANPHFYFERGLLFLKQGNPDLALLDFNTALARKSDYVEACFQRGLTHDMLGDDEQALADYSQVLRLNPAHVAAWNNRGLLFAAQRQNDLALHDFGEAVRIDPTFAAAYINRAQILSRSGKLDDALADCQQALSHDTKSTAAYLMRGSILAQAGRLPAAADDFSQVLRLGMQTAQVYYLRGVVALKMDRSAEALADLTEAIRLNPKQARAYAQRAAIFQSSGQHQLALDDLAHAVRLDRRYASSFCSMAAAVQQGMDKPERAVAFFTVALLLDPKNEEVRTQRKEAWKAYVAQSRKRPPRPRRNRHLNGAVKQAAGPPPATPSAPGTHTFVRVAETGEGPLAGKGAAETAEAPPVHTNGTTAAAPAAQAPPVAEIPQLEVVEEAALEDAETEAPVLVDDTSFSLNLPQQAQAQTASVETEQNAAAPAETSEEDAQTEQEAEVAEVETPAAPEEDAHKQESNRERWQQLRDEYLRKEAEASRKREESRKAAAKKARKRTDDDEDGLPLWKKGVVALAGCMVVWWCVSGAMAFFSGPPKLETVPVAGKVMLAKGKQPAAKLLIRFLPVEETDKQQPAFASTDADGKFQLTTYTKGDGAAPGRYVVVVQARPFAPTLAPFIANKYMSAETSPLRFVIKKGEPVKLPPISLQAF